MRIVNVIAPSGEQLSFYVRDQPARYQGDMVVIGEAFTENTYALYPEHFMHTGIFVDIGANIGAVSILAYSLGAKKIVAYEPEPDNFEMILKNMSINAAANIEAHQKGVWSSETSIPLLASQSASTSNPEAVKANPDLVIQVPTVTLKQVLAPFDDVDVLKVDTEGAEYEIFRDRETNRKARMIVIEYHTTTTDKFGGLLALLSLTHHITAFGHYDTDGGQIYGKRY